MNVCIQLPLRSPKMQDQKSLTLCWLSFSGWGKECFSLVFDYKGGQDITQWQRYTNVNILRLAIGYLNMTMKRSTWILEPEIETNGSSQTQQNLRVDWHGSGFCPHRCRGLGFCTGLEQNRTIVAVRTVTAGRLPGPIANSSDVAINGHIQSCDWLYRLKRSESLIRSLENELNLGCLGGFRGNIACCLSIKAAISQYIDVCDHSQIRSPNMHNQKSLSLPWCSMSRWGRECVALSISHKGSQYCDFI